MTHTIAVQSSTGYDLLHFTDEAHAKAYVAVNQLKGARRPSDAYGRKQNEIDLTGYLGERIESLATSIELGELDQPAKRVEIAETKPAPSKTYVAAGQKYTFTQGQRIGLRNQLGVVPAVITKLGYAWLVVAIDNGRGRNVEKTIDCTTTGTINSVSAIVPQGVTA